MQDKGRRISKGKLKYDPAPHPDKLVDQVLRLTDGFKDEYVTTAADLAPSYLTHLRTHRTKSPRIGEIQKVLSVLGYELTIIKKGERKV